MMLAPRRRRECASDLRSQVRLLVAWPTRTGDTPMVARTLTQHAVPTTFGLKVAQLAASASSTRTTTWPRSSFPFSSAEPPAPWPQ